MATAITALCNAPGASGSGVTKPLDRHPRDARTVASHNPQILKARIVGDREINGTGPTYVWAIRAANIT
ncbi:hypothetical protein [Burkholderia glumae]